VGFFGRGERAPILDALAQLTTAVTEGFSKMSTTINQARADLVAAAARLQASTANELNVISGALLAASQPNGSVAAADVEAAVANINKVSDSLDASAKTLTTPAPPVSTGP
jgi:hypothetical protein